MRISSSFGRHSALMRMQLIVKGASVRIEQLEADFLFIKSSGDHSSTRATIEMQVEDFQHA